MAKEIYITNPYKKDQWLRLESYNDEIYLEINENGRKGYADGAMKLNRDMAKKLLQYLQKELT